MAGPNTAVAFTADAPLEAIEMLLKRIVHAGGYHNYLNCMKVETTDFGMLRLTPAQEGYREVTIYMHPEHVLYMLRAADSDRQKIGFGV